MSASLEIVKLALSLITPIVIAILGFFLNRRLKQTDQKNEERHQRDIEAKEQERDKQERRHALRIEFALDALFHGPQKGFYLAEFIATINNKSLIQKKFTTITLRIRGIKKDGDIGLWTATVKDKQTKEPKEIKTERISFPEKILKESIIPPQWNYVFVEPDVKQELAYTTPIPEDICYILATVEFHYDANTPHTAERMFALQAPPSKNMSTITQGVNHV